MAVLLGLLAVSVAFGGVMFWGGRMRRAASNPCLLIGVGWLAFAGELKSQTHWRYGLAAGGAVVGGTLGVAIDAADGVLFGSPPNSGDDIFRLPHPSLVIGPLMGMVGFGYGYHADLKLSRGDSLTRAQQWRVRNFMFAAPIALAASSLFAIESENVRKGVAPIAVGGGVVAGYLLDRRFKGALHPRVNVAGESVGLSFNVRF